MTVEVQIAIALVAMGWLYAFIIGHWQRGLCLLLGYLPFAGVIAYSLGLWQGAMLLKDLLFVVPIYFTFAFRLVMGRESVTGFPKAVAFLMLAITAIVVMQTFNPGVPNFMIGLIGLKVWLFYMPLCFIGYAFADSSVRILSLLRLLVGLSFIPAAVALLELAMVHHIGYRSAMSLIYGAAAPSATQQFASFTIGDKEFGRIPSTFTFVTQFFGYSLAMLTPAYIVWSRDFSPTWRRLGGLALIASAFAAFISGAREAFVFVPLTMILTVMLDRGIAGLVPAISGLTLVTGLAVIAMIGAKPWQLYELIGQLFIHYSESIAYGALVQALAVAPLGMGTGTNTGAARYAMADPGGFIGFENYFAKAAFELGIPGLALILFLLLLIIWLGFRARAQLNEPPLRCCAASFLGFFIIMFANSFKGWQLDLDPINVYYWLFAGVMLRLPSVAVIEDAGAAAQRACSVPRRYSPDGSAINVGRAPLNSARA